MQLSMRLFRAAAVAAAIAFLAFAWGQQGAPPAEAAFNDTDGDGAIDLAEIIGSSDPNNPASILEDTGADFVSGFPSCSDGLDNDLDGLTDVDDNGCHDSDNSIVSDAMESFLGADPNDAASQPEDSRFDAVLEFVGFGFLISCGDALDNDLDGDIDGEDQGCTPIRNDDDDFDDATEKRFGSDPANANSVPEHELPNPGSCTDGLDNDLDGFTDAADPACGVPDNDDRADATVIASLPFTSGAVPMKNATTEQGEPRPTCSFGGLLGTVWYRHTAAADGVLIADTIGSNSDTLLAVWRDDGARLSQLACDYGYDGPEYQARAAFAVESGATYLFQIQVAPFGTALPSLTFNLVTGVPPANDGFLNATVIGSLPFSDSVDTDAATAQFGEPAPFCSYGQVQSTVWYTFTPSSDALLVADTAGSDFPTGIGVYTESKFGLAPVDCATSNVIFDGQEETIIPARAGFDVEAGTTYHIQIGGVFDETFGTVQFTLELGTPPPHDDFANATTIASLPFEDDADLLTASAELDEPPPSCFFEGQPSATVWYRYTAPRDLAVEVGAENTYFANAFIVVYQGSALDDLTAIGCGSPYVFYPHTRLGFQAEAGETYYIQMGTSSYAGFRGGDGGSAGVPDVVSSGHLTLTASEIAVPSCGAPDFTFDDPVGDTLFPPPPPPPPLTSPDVPPPPPAGPAAHDIVSVSGGRTGENYCLTVRFDGPIDPPSAATNNSVFTYFAIDVDENQDTGYRGSSCDNAGLLGIDLEFGVSDAGLLIPLYPQLTPPPPDGDQYTGLVLYDTHTVTFILPMDVLTVQFATDERGPEAFNFTLYAYPYFGPLSDCVPNGGFVHAPDPARAGDINCDGRVNAIDTVLILQMVAGLIPGVPCPWVADVNGTGIIGPIDAQLILQFDAGLLPELEMAPVG